MTCRANAGTRAVTAAGRSWHAVLGACLDQLEPLPEAANLGIVYLGDAVAPMADVIVQALRARTGIRDWLGAGASAVLGGPDGASDDGLAVMVTSLPAAGFRILPAREPPPMRLGLLLAHAELGETGLGTLLADLGRHGAATVVGALMAAGRSPVQIADTVMGGAAACIGFGADLPVVAGIATAGSPLGPVHRVTSAVGSELRALDGRPALDVMTDELGDLFRRAGGRFAANLWLAEQPESTTAPEALRMRWISAVDRRRRSLRLEGGRPGAAVRLMRPDPAASQARVRTVARELRARLNGVGPTAGLYLASRHRGRSLFGPAADEIGWLREELGPLPMIGLVSDAEIFEGALHEAAGILVLIGGGEGMAR